MHAPHTKRTVLLVIYMAKHENSSQDFGVNKFGSYLICFGSHSGKKQQLPRRDWALLKQKVHTLRTESTFWYTVVRNGCYVGL